MLVFRHVACTGRRFRRPVVTLGSFDGVHVGHRTIFDRVVATARARDADALVLTFEPHPAAVLAPGRTPLRLTDWRARVDRIAAAGVDAVIVERFTRRFSEISAADFVERLLVDGLDVGAVVVGHRVSFGHRRGGNAETLHAFGAKHGFSVEVIGPVRVGDAEVSSSAIRTAILDGDLARATALLGHPPLIAGRVGRGDRRGAGLGFPTANLAVEGWAAPPNGVYAVEAVVAGAPQPAVANLGVRPTFGERQRGLEVHLLDWDGDLYGRRVEVQFRARIRGEMRFDGPEALVRQIASDVGEARRILTPGST